MDYIPPPPPAYEYVSTQTEQKNRFIIKVDEALYNQPNMQATIRMTEAFQKSHRIESYNGDWITLVYQDSVPKLGSCPIVDVPIKNIQRNIDYWDNEVTFTISNVSKDLADSIEYNLCLLIGTHTVKKVSNPDFNGTDDKIKYN